MSDSSSVKFSLGERGYRDPETINRGSGDPFQRRTYHPHLVIGNQSLFNRWAAGRRLATLRIAKPLTAYAQNAANPHCCSGMP
jgi:hypothetical protein